MGHQLPGSKLKNSWINTLLKYVICYTKMSQMLGIFRSSTNDYSHLHGKKKNKNKSQEVLNIPLTQRRSWATDDWKLSCFFPYFPILRAGSPTRSQNNCKSCSYFVQHCFTPAVYLSFLLLKKNIFWENNWYLNPMFICLNIYSNESDTTGRGKKEFV